MPDPGRQRRHRLDHRVLRRGHRPDAQARAPRGSGPHLPGTQREHRLLRFLGLPTAVCMSSTSPLKWRKVRPMQDELRAVAESLAARLHRAVAMDDPHLRLLVHTSHDKNVDEHRVHSVLRRQSPPDLAEHVFSHGIAAAAGLVRIPGSPDRRMLGRVCVPMRCETRLFGYLWLIDDGDPVADDELRLAVEAAAAAGQLLHRHPSLRASCWVQERVSGVAAPQHAGRVHLNASVVRRRFEPVPTFSELAEHRRP